MNNKTPCRSEPRPGERPFGHIASRWLPHQENEHNSAAQHMSTIPEYRITIEHGSIRIGQETGTGYEEPGRELWKHY